MPPQTNRPIVSFAQTDNQKFVPIMPAISIASQTTALTSGSTGIISVNTATALIRVFCKDAGVYLKWGSAPSTSVFDEYVPAGQIVELAVPLENSANLHYLEGDATTGTLIVTQK